MATSDAGVKKKTNKVAYGDAVLIDLTADTVTANTLKSGATAHDAAGNSITGTLTVPTQQTKNVDLSMASGNQIIKPDSGKVLSQATIIKPSTMLPENIKKDVNIGGVVGTLESGGGSDCVETWVLNDHVEMPLEALADIDAVYDGVNFTVGENERYDGIHFQADDCFQIFYITGDASDYVDEVCVYGGNYNSEGVVPYIYMEDKQRLKISFEQSYPTGDLLTWLQANATMQPPNIALQPFKSVEITANGTTTVTPDVPYDALSKVDLTVDVDIPIKETWVWNSSVDLGESNSVYSIDFESNGKTYGYIRINGIGGALQYYDKSYTTIYDTTWIDSVYRKITFSSPPTGYLLTFLQANATKQLSDVALQPSKSVEITANGTTTVTPDVPYDGLQSVEVVGNMAGSSDIYTYTIAWHNPID